MGKYTKPRPTRYVDLEVWARANCMCLEVLEEATAAAAATAGDGLRALTIVAEAIVAEKAHFGEPCAKKRKCRH